jgi:hypothetical protein
VIISEEEFAGMFRSFSRTAFRLETQPHYAMTVERDAFGLFLAGSPLPPSRLPWWQAWLDDMRELTRQGKKIGRVRVHTDPPSDYQRWEMWATDWHLDAGEDIRYLPADTAASLRIPLRDWWLFDGNMLVEMRFTPDGEIDGKTLVTDPEVVRVHCAWRDLAVRHATTAGHSRRRVPEETEWTQAMT